MTVSARITLDHPAIRKMLSTTGRESARRAADITVRRTRQNIVSSGRIRTGAMLASVRVAATDQRQERVESTVVVAVPYAIFQERGTRYFSGAFFLQRAMDRLTVRDFVPPGPIRP